MTQTPAVLVTRPSAQAEGLCRRIQALGWRPLAFPLLAIEPVSIDPIEASGYHWLIFVSRNAVLHGLPRLRGALPRLATVGQGSADELAGQGLQVDLVPDTTADSEGLLAMPPLQRLQGQRILILRGEGGRPLLAEQLRARGAQVDFAEVYRRCLPLQDEAQLMALWPQVDLVLTSSNQALQNLMYLLGEQALPRLANKTLLVVSQRGHELARKWGIRHLIQAESATDEAVVAAMLRWRQDDTLCSS